MPIALQSSGFIIAVGLTSRFWLDGVSVKVELRNVRAGAATSLNGFSVVALSANLLFLIALLSLMQANDVIEKDRPAAAKMVAKFLKMPLELATELMPKLEFDMNWKERSLEAIRDSAQLLSDQKKLKAPLDFSKYVYMDLLKAVRPQSVEIKELPKT